MQRRLSVRGRAVTIAAMPPGNLLLGQLADSIYVITNVDAKTALHGHSGSLAVDMESAAIAEVAAKHEVQYVAIRAITDSVEMVLPEELMDVINPYGQVRFRKLFATLLAHPGPSQGEG